MKTVDFSEFIAASDLKVGRCRQLNEIMKVSLVLKVKVISLPYFFQVLYVLCSTRPRYQVSVYRTIGPLVQISMRSHPLVLYVVFRLVINTKCHTQDTL